MTFCILTIIKNEQDYLDEWIKYHLNLGINHIFIFEDICSESHKEITDKYNFVTLDSIMNLFNDEKDIQEILELKKTKRFNPHIKYLHKGLDYIKTKYNYDWCFAIDNDEFLTLKNPKSDLENTFSLFKNYDAVLLQWMCYGANGIIKKPDYNKKGVIDTFTTVAKGAVPNSRFYHTKVCYNMSKYKSCYFENNHYPSLLCKWCRTDFSRKRLTPIYNHIYIRHYITRSWEEYIWKLSQRGYLFGKSRTYDFFFKVNPDMLDKKEELLKLVEPILNKYSSE